MTKQVRRLRGNATDVERRLWQSLRYRQLGARFRRQYPIPPYIVDFACVEARLVIEADGGQHNSQSGNEERDAFLRRAGWRVLRFWNNDILQNREGVLQIIAAALIDRSPEPTESLLAPTPTLPRARGREGPAP
ncbi:MAG TPA: endonuclease domain-containing protein [Stellaceae bacterium]|jgi:very-short-patch-repair endonuclease|nr:endonuclease domain-containing protein [Stellaceae bacterium]